MCGIAGSPAGACRNVPKSNGTPEKRQPSRSGSRPPSLSERQISGMCRRPAHSRDPVLLAHVHRRGGAGQDGRVDGDDRHAAAVDAAEAGDHAVARGDLLGAAELGFGEHAQLVPGAWIDQLVDALASRLAVVGANLLDIASTAAFKALTAPALELLVRVRLHGRFR